MIMDMSMKGMMILVVSALLSPAVGYAQPGGWGPEEGPGRPEPSCGCCCCCSRQDRKPPVRRPGVPPSADELMKRLSLSDEQTAKWKEEEAAFRSRMEEMRPDRKEGEQPDPEKWEEMKEKMDTAIREHEAVVKSILSDEQYELYQKYREESRPPRPEGNPDGPENDKR